MFTKAIDPRFGAAVWARYAPLVGEALKVWPETTDFRPPPNVALSTFIARWRDSLIGYRVHRWEHSYFSWEDFAKIDGQFCLRAIQDENIVRFDHRQPRGRPTLASSSSASRISTPSQFGPFTSPLTSSELHAFLLLLNNGRIFGSLHIPSPPPDLSTYPNIAIASQTPETTILL